MCASLLKALDHAASSKGNGRPVLRKEAFRLLTGAGCFCEDVNLPGQVYAMMIPGWILL